MASGWKYRLSSAVGIGVLTLIAVIIANHPVSQRVFTTYIPLFNRLDVVVLTGTKFYIILLVAIAAVVVAQFPLFKPKPRRILDVLFLVQKRIVVAGLALATLGYFEWTYRVPRATLVMTIGMLFIVGPLWFVWVRQQPTTDPDNPLLIGDDPEQLQRIATEVDLNFVGFLAPLGVFGGENESTDSPQETIVADGGITGELRHLGGLSRLEDVLVEYGIDTVVLAFRKADRAEFFGALDACYKHGVSAKMHRDYATTVLTSKGNVRPLVDIEIEPWDIQDYALKRLFDIAFAGIALLILSPVIALIVVSIKIEGEGPVFFKQRRTNLFGETFTVYKFRTLRPDPDGEIGTSFEASRETALGNFLRMTHLDEIPQLWSILKGDMSVVGPRPAQTDLEAEFEAEAEKWRHRWFVKPGLTGLAQVNDATSSEPQEKIQYDIQYIRTQSFMQDLKIVSRQIWKVLIDVYSLLK